MAEKKKEDEQSGACCLQPPKKPDLGLLEEDDEFEEFPAEGRRWFRLYSDTLF